jgi:O-antigen/teichoic acid export membrane protein
VREGPFSVSDTDDLEVLEALDAPRPSRLSADLLVYGLGEALVKGITFISLPIYTRLFTPEAYGELSLATTVVGLVATFLALGSDTAYARFYFEAQGAAARRVLTTTWLGFLAIWSSAIALACVLAAAPLSRLVFGDERGAPLLAVGLLAAPLSLTNQMLGQVLRNQFRAPVFTAFSLLNAALTVGLGVYAVAVLGLGPIGVLVGALAAQALILPLRLLSTRDSFGRAFEPALLRRLVAFGAPIVPASLAFWVFLTSDRIVLGRLSTLEQVGLYSVAVSLVGVASIAIAALGQAWTPHLVRRFEEDRAAAAQFVGQMLVYCIAGFGFLAVGFTALAPEGLAVIAGQRYGGAAAAIGPLALGMVAYASVQMTAAGIQLMKQTRYLAIHAWVAALINVGLNLLLDGPYGMVGAAWATAISYGYLTLAYLATSQRLWPIAIPHRRTLFAIALVAAYTIVASFLPTFPLLVAIVLKGAYTLSYVVVLLVTGVLGRAEVEQGLELVQTFGRTLARRPSAG